MSARKHTIAVLGATGYIGRSLMAALVTDDEVSATGYARDLVAARAKLAKFQVPAVDLKAYSELLETEYEVVINATGIGSPKKLKQNPFQVHAVTEEMDRLLGQYLDLFPSARIFNLSSGAVYGLSACEYVSADTKAQFDINKLSVKDSYAIAKLASEAKHRAMDGRAVVDLRVFAFVSRYLEVAESFLVSEIAQSLKQQTMFKTSPADLVRDFVTAGDIAGAVKFLLEREPVNEAFDLKSAGSVGKFELLKHLQAELGLKYKMEAQAAGSPTGEKNIYAPAKSRLESMGFHLTKTSLQNVTDELKAYLSL